VAFARDVTDRKLLEEASERYKEALELAVAERTAELQRRSDELDEARLETLRMLALAAEYRDHQTFEHTERVGRTAALLAERLGEPERNVILIRQAAPLHDIGKLAVSDTILLKPGKLTSREFEEVKRHTLHGREILSGSVSDVLRLARDIALTHHEWWDGTGYPYGLHGSEIPQCGRIVAVADVFDALTHERPYKAAWPVDQAVEELHQLRGRQFDPGVVDAFEELEPGELAHPCSTASPLGAVA
jgi:putative two-component system response regulator